MSRNSASGLLLLAAFFWGAGNVANKTVLAHIDPLTAVCLRALLAALIIAPFAAREMRLTPKPQGLQSAMLVALLFAAALVFQQYAYKITTVTNASFLVNTSSIMVPLLGWALLGQRPNLRISLAALITVGGALLMAGQVSLAHMNRGDIACIISAAFYAGWMIALGHHAATYQRPFFTSLVQFSVTAAVLAPLSALFEIPQLGNVQAALPELLVLGVFSTAAAFALQATAQRYVQTSVAAVLVSAESLFGAAGAWLLLGELTPTTGLIGAALILGGIVIAATGAAPLLQTPLPNTRGATR